jgi:excisionase family DNA binding protein
VARSFQQQSLFRKIVYILLIVAIFTTTLILRRADGFGIDSQGQALEIREENLGEVELAGSAFRLMLTGSRGFAVLVLWWTATEKQKRHEWNELELLVKSVTKLQPHFITPWMFQSWNLAYNVSMESDLVRDKYFYITEGVKLLADGEKLNRNNPDLRFYLGFCNQHKIGLADEANSFRCLYQMSCIDPVERDANRMRRADEPNSVDVAKFEQFCQRHPMLVRRLREVLKRDTPGDVLEFLADNRRIPSMYEERPRPSETGIEPRTDLLPVDKRFPVLPVAADITGRADPAAIDFDNYQVARDWYTYAQEPLPPADPVKNVTDPDDFDHRKYRLPKFSTNIFRSYPARAQFFVAENLEKEGWFDKDGWTIAGWFPDDKFQNGEEAVVAKGIDWGTEAWAHAHRLYEDYGTRTGLYLTPELDKSLDEQAKPFRQFFDLRRDTPFRGTLPNEFRESPDLLKSFRAHQRLYYCDHYREQTNFAYFFYKSLVESDPKTVQLRKAIFEADQLRNAGEREQALERYRQILPRLRDLMLANEEFQRDANVQEESYTVAVRADQLFQDLYGKRFRELWVLGNFLGQPACRPSMPAPWVPPGVAARDFFINIGTPLDDIILTPPEAAAYLSAPGAEVKDADVVRMIQKRGLTGHQVGSDWRLLKSEVDAWLRKPEQATLEAAASGKEPEGMPLVYAGIRQMTRERLGATISNLAVRRPTTTGPKRSSGD